jgi:hypothetical protein
MPVDRITTAVRGDGRPPRILPPRGMGFIEHRRNLRVGDEMKVPRAEDIL